MSRLSNDCITDRKYVLKFGKYKMYSIEEILQVDPQYLVWLADNTAFDLDHKLYDEAAEKAVDWRP